MLHQLNYLGNGQYQCRSCGEVVKKGSPEQIDGKCPVQLEFAQILDGLAVIDAKIDGLVAGAPGPVPDPVPEPDPAT